ncbi:hypothetical protein ACTA71_009295 [Dictyostelium dimigraforme]
MDNIIITTFNVGGQGGKGLGDSKAFKIDLLLNDNSYPLKKSIVCLQEAYKKLKGFENYNNIKNNSVTRKGNQLRIIFDKSEFECVEIIKTDIRAQIVLMKQIKSGGSFILVNCHIGKRGLSDSDGHLKVLKAFISKINQRELPIIVVGDFNRNQHELTNELKFANEPDVKTTGSSCIDHIMYSDMFFRPDKCSILKCLSNNLIDHDINHNAVRCKFSILEQKKRDPNVFIKNIQNIFNGVSGNIFENQFININKDKEETKIKSKKENKKKNESDKKNGENDENKIIEKEDDKRSKELNCTNITKGLFEILEEIWKKEKNCNKLNMSKLYKDLNDKSFTYDQLYYFIKKNPSNENCKKSVTKYLKERKIDYQFKTKK